MTPSEILAALDANSLALRETCARIQADQVQLTRLSVERARLDAEYRKLVNLPPVEY